MILANLSERGPERVITITTPSEAVSQMFLFW
jgi:hypothetical protein